MGDAGLPVAPALTPPGALEGFTYHPDFLDEGEERALLAFLAGETFGEVRMHGVVARRQVRHYGLVYTYDGGALRPGPPLPAALAPLRERAAALIERPPEDLAEVLLTRYPPGAPIGWHRDAPQFGPRVVGVSLGGAAEMRFRRGPGHPIAFRRTLEPRSAYVIGGAARASWQHSIPAVKQERYSVTFRTVRRRLDEREPSAET